MTVEPNGRFMRNHIRPVLPGSRLPFFDELDGLDDATAEPYVDATLERNMRSANRDHEGSKAAPRATTGRCDRRSFCFNQ